MDSAALWDRKYAEGLPSLTKPDPFFISAYERVVNKLFPNAGRALDLAAGLGRHSLWLAERAWHVSALDVSGVAIAKLGRSARQRKVNVNAFAVDAAEYRFEPAGFDLIVLFYHLDRSLFPKIVSSLKPGGLFICKMAVQWGSYNSAVKTNFEPLGRNELPSLVPRLQIVDHNERAVNDRGVVEFAGMKSMLSSRSAT